MFLSYRVSSEADLVEKLYDKLRAHHVNAWWDKKCLPAGQPWEEGFADGVMKSQVFVPILSKAALAPFATLQSDARCDNVLLEYRLALELKARGELQAIFPVFVGEAENFGSLGEGYGDFFRGGGLPAAPDVLVDAVEAKLLEHLQRAGKGTPVLNQADSTAKSVLQEITKHQGEFLRGAPKREQIEKVVMALIKVAGETAEPPSSLSASWAGPGAPSSLAAADLSQSAGPILQPSRLAAMSLGGQPDRQRSIAEYPNLSLERYKAQPFFHHINMHFPGLQLVRKEPYVFVIDNFLSTTECDELVKKIIFSSEQKLSAGHGEQRTSMSVIARDAEVAGIRARLADLAAVDVRQLQPTKLTRYDTGQRFVEHTDAIYNNVNMQRLKERIAAGQVFGEPCGCDDRFVTIFVYLNDVARGGRTRFLSPNSRADFYETMLPALGKQLPGEAPAAATPHVACSPLDVVPVKGRAVLHFPTTRREVGCLPDYNTGHEGEEAIDPKFIMQQFVWSTAVDPSNGTLDELVCDKFTELLDAASGPALSSSVL